MEVTGRTALALGLAAAIVLAGPPLGAARAPEYLQTLKDGTWICVSPDAYDQAVQQQNAPGMDLESLKKDLLDRKQCMYLDAEWVENMMAPFARVLERQGTKVRVEFTIEFRKRIEFLHRQINRITFAGWTDSANLVDKEIL
jgi:hypothetical protein